MAKKNMKKQKIMYALNLDVHGEHILYLNEDLSVYHHHDYSDGGFDTSSYESLLLETKTMKIENLELSYDDFEVNGEVPYFESHVEQSYNKFVKPKVQDKIS